jgi:hypothetical protein
VAPAGIAGGGGRSTAAGGAEGASAVDTTIVRISSPEDAATSLDHDSTGSGIASADGAEAAGVAEAAGAADGALTLVEPTGAAARAGLVSATSNVYPEMRSSSPLASGDSMPLPSGCPLSINGTTLPWSRTKQPPSRKNTVA